MRRFVRTVVVRSHAQFTVLQDAECKVFEVWRWAARERTNARLATYPYGAVKAADAKAQAIRHAEDLAAAEEIQVHS